MQGDAKSLQTAGVAGAPLTSRLHAEDLIRVERDLGHNYEVTGGSAEHYQWIHRGEWHRLQSVAPFIEESGTDFSLWRSQDWREHRLKSVSRFRWTGYVMSLAPDTGSIKEFGPHASLRQLRLLWPVL